MDRPVRIANCSGFYGDRMSALAEMVEGGPVDVITGDYLAEVTMLVLAKNRQKRPDGGYASTFLRQLAPVVTRIAERRIKVVVNAGGLDPAGCADATRTLLADAGVDLAVAHVEGDDLAARVPALLADGHDLAHLDTGEPFGRRHTLTANAYLGGFGVQAALAAGADIVITGRVADASLVSGAAAWWWRWTPADLDALAGAVIAGHVIECGAQATGGNFSGFQEIADLTHPGFPLAEVDRDGASVITKHEGTGGAVTVDTVTAQLLYEIGAPGYLNPDVVAHLDSARLAQEGPDRVRVSGVRGSAPPPTTKVAITGPGGWRNESTFVLTGIDVDAKAALVEQAIRARLDGDPGIGDLRFTRIGTPAGDPADQMAGSSLLHVAVDGEQGSAGRAFSSLCVELALANYPGIYGMGVPGRGTAFGTYWPTLVPQDLLDHTVVHADGRREVVPPPPATAPYETGTPAVPEPYDEGVTVAGPLGRLVRARSGDKGGNANVGLWVTDPEAWPWLRATMTTERLRALLPEAAGLPVDRYELPNLRAVNFVVRGLLDGGATEARRFDKQAKALGEWIRARHVPIPERLLPGHHRE
ncbi:acyclic terpene utilization AtuA family protein [Actinoallomurus iriomotensis]|uniref:Exopolyphosphatase n=1 Tax=Actinoallomurus iriomotensis TaxID=478107 RepID=A0A9W6VUG2_9ACTN|nr:acyclic terpene utilization AtuA family protein [Actinoallomurus iriomotensis]GLY78651.1 exopolyphosphatase [Actinoallomurus iriomotensis]